MEDKQETFRSAWFKMNEDEIQAAYILADSYVDFLNKAKTEREAVDYITNLAYQHGFVDFGQVMTIEPGQKLLFQTRGKICGLMVVGEESLEKGLNMVVSHLDSPRLDLKPVPLYQSEGLALFKTHYYGGIKKYQWLAMPLALHGTVVKPDGQIIRICIGEEEGDPVFTIADLLPHLAKEQMEQKMGEAIKGESLNALVGSRPDTQVEGERVKKNILSILAGKYHLEEDDFTSAELQLVPAFRAREVGLDHSLVGGYGQDDRSSAYTSLKAILEVSNPVRTALALFVDKEEIGSNGNTGLQSLIIENMLAGVMSKAGHGDYYSLRRSLFSSHALSADVNAAVDPNYPDVFEKMNCSFLGNGVVMTKYTGSRGKYDSSDANPEFLGPIRKLFTENGVVWQVGELGKVDIGGGGTVAHYMARYGMEVVDCGVAVLGMHSPFEVVSKADLYMAYKAYRAFLQSFSN
ncbi:aminopeptidase [Syntrophomonas erecta]